MGESVVISMRICYAASSTAINSCHQQIWRRTRRLSSTFPPFGRRLCHRRSPCLSRGQMLVCWDRLPRLKHLCSSCAARLMTGLEISQSVAFASALQLLPSQISSALLLLVQPSRQALQNPSSPLVNVVASALMFHTRPSYPLLCYSAL